MEKKYSIYCLQNSINNEIFYVGATSVSLNYRLKNHYSKLNDVLKDNIANTPTFEYLKNLLPVKANIVLIEEVTIDNIDERERFYIKLYSEKYRLTNLMPGGKGGNTFKVQTDLRKAEISKKISNKIKGKPKPEGFALNLSIRRTGLNNPACRISKYGWFIKFDLKNNPLKLFKYSFELGIDVNSKNVLTNIRRVCQTGGTAYNFKWKFYNNCSKEIQDIVQSMYESM